LNCNREKTRYQGLKGFASGEAVTALFRRHDGLRNFA
jgi:hypothetical protein